MGGIDKEINNLMEKGKRIIGEKAKADIAFDNQKRAVEDQLKIKLYEKYPIERLERLRTIVISEKINAHLATLDSVIKDITEEDIKETTFVNLDSLLKIYGDKLDKNKTLSERILRIFVKEDKNE